MPNAPKPACDAPGKVERCASVPHILDAVVELTGMRFAAVARVTDTQWMACAVRDDLGFGLAPGGELDLHTTICNEIRQHREPVVFGHASQHPVYREHHTPKHYGLESYISVPIFRRDGDFFGTLCAIDSLPNTVDADASKVNALVLFAQLIGCQLDMADELDASQARLATFEKDLSRVAETERDLRDLLQPVVSGLYLLRSNDVLPAPDRAMLADMEMCCTQIGAVLRDRLDAADMAHRVTGEEPA